MPRAARYVPNRQTGDSLEDAAHALREGRLVVFPTETVYGLGANALDPVAVARIFDAKGRPSSNPLIVHVSDVAMARSLASHWPDAAQRIAERLWPGPVTVVVPRGACVPDVVAAGGPTVAIRMPDHPAALDLIRLARVPVAAPSANVSGAVSPTRIEDLSERIRRSAAWIVDAGPCHYGLESTVVDTCTNPVRVLRPGAVSRAELEDVLGAPVVGGAMSCSGPVRSPGMLGRHYAPKAELRLVAAPSAEEEAWLMVASRAAWITHDQRHAARFGSHPEVIVMPDDPAEYGRRLYATLQELDRQGVTRILVEEPPDTVEWEAVRDRLHRASLR